MREGYKNSALGEIPKSWEVKNLDDFTDEITDYVAAGSFASLKENVNVFTESNHAIYVRLTDLRKGLGHSEQKYVDEKSYNFLSKSNLYGNEILFANIGANVGEAWMMPEINKKATVAPNMIVIRANNKNVVPKYLHAYLSSSIGLRQIDKIIAGSGHPKINKTELRKLTAILPPLPEQQKIAEILSTVDAKINLITQRIAQTQNLKKGLMQRLLTKGMGHTEFKDSPLGEIPKSWEVKELDEMGIELIDGDRGSNYPKSKDFSDEGFCLFLSAKNVTKKGFKFNECQFISKERDILLRKGKLAKYDFVITTRGSVGHVAFYDDSIPFEHVRLNSGMVILRDSKKNYDTKFLYQFMKSPIFDSQVEFITSGSAQPQLTIKGLKKLNLPILPLEEQLVIGDVLSTISNKLAVLQNKKTHYQALKKGLMQQLLTGKVRVTGLIKEVV